jgi:hypothetical protein
MAPEKSIHQTLSPQQAARSQGPFFFGLIVGNMAPSDRIQGLLDINISVTLS